MPCRAVRTRIDHGVARAGRENLHACSVTPPSEPDALATYPEGVRIEPRNRRKP